MTRKTVYGKPRSSRRQPRSEETRTKFARKVELLESWVKAGGPPDGQNWPLGPVALRNWTDVSLGLEAWSSPNVATPRGRYADLRGRFDSASKKLKELSSNGSKANVRALVQEAKALNKILAAQVLTMRCQIRKRDAALARSQALLKLTSEREAELTAELAKLRPLRAL